MGQPHKHAALIKAWADGAEIQWRPGAPVDWWDTNYPYWNADYEYRVKPVTITLKYRLALFRDAHGLYVRAVNSKNYTDWESHYMFIRWIGEEQTHIEEV